VTLRVGVVGAGVHCTENILPALSQADDCSLAAVCTTTLASAERAKSRWGFTAAYTSFDEMISSGAIDAVVAVGPPELHVAVGRAALENRIHVFVEKPIASSLGQAVELANLARSCPDIVTFVGCNFRFATPMQDCLRLATHFGQPTAVRLLLTSNKPRLPLWDVEMEPSFLLAVGVHALDLGVELLGPPSAVRVVRTPASNVVTLSVLAEHAGGRTSAYWLGNHSNALDFKAEVVCSEAVVAMDNFRRIGEPKRAPPGISSAQRKRSCTTSRAWREAIDGPATKTRLSRLCNRVCAVNPARPHSNGRH
jgi:predicted dehydrogenase